MTTTLERRTFAGTVEVREVGNAVVAQGYAAVFGRRSQNLGGFVEAVEPTAFTKTVQESDVRALWNHEAGALLGRLRAGTLRLEVDEVGLRYEVDLPNTTHGRDVAEMIRRGDVTGSSFGFRAILDSWGETEDGFPIRSLKEVALRDVGPVTFPAYTDATASLRSLAEARHVPLDEVLAAAAAGNLRHIITPAPAGLGEQGRPPATRSPLVPRWRAL